MMFSLKLTDALVFLQLVATSCHLGEAVAAVHTGTDASVSVDLNNVDGGSSEENSADIGNGTSEYVNNADSVWIAASSPPIAETTSAPEEMPTGDDDMITTDAAVIGSVVVDQSYMNANEAPHQSESVAAPIYALRHGRGIFAIAGGTGCYEGARGQAQANFGIQSSRVDLFVPSISWIFDDMDDIGIGPQDTSWKRTGSNRRRLSSDHGGGTVQDANSSRHFNRRLQSPQECPLLREGADSFTIISLNLERRSNPPGNNKHVKDSSTLYHEHGEFQAQEQWFEGISGEYTLSCVHHDCNLFFYFGIGPSTNDISSTRREKRNLLNDEDDDEDDKDGNDQMMTSLNLQGTTELAFQGSDVDMLVCIENCEVGGSTYDSKIEVDAEHYEAINLRNFDNTDRLVQLDSRGKGNSAKGTKAPKASKGTIFVNTNECLVLSQACSDNGKGKSKGGSKGTSGCADVGKGSKGSKGSYGPSAYENAPDGTVCTGGTCLGGVCVAAAAAPASGAAAALILPQNNPPLPADDLYSFIGGTIRDVVYTDEVLQNDVDPDSDPLTVFAVNQDSRSVGMETILPSGASLTVEADGSFIYDPGSLFESLHTGDFATETFEYTVSDGQRNTETATVTIVIEGNNDPPLAADDTETTTEDTTVSSSVLLNDSDPEGDRVRLIVDTMNGSSGNVGQEIILPSGAKVFLTSDGLYTFDPNGQYESLNDSETALVTFEYTITDGFGGTAGATATIAITGVNDPPVAENDDLGPAPAGLPVTYNLLTNDVNPEQQDELLVTEVEGQSVSSSGSTTISLSSGALLTIDGSTGEMTVDPNGQFESLDDGESVLLTFEYVITDENGVTDSAIVTLTLQGSNDPPFAEDVSKATRPGSVVSATLLDNDGDPEDDPLTVTQVEDALLNPMTGDIVVTLPSGALVTVNALGQYTYDPNGQFDSLDANEEGIDTFTYAIADGHGGTDEATVTILMPGANDHPDAEDDSKTTLPTSTVSDSAILPNDSDPEDDDLTLTEANGERIDPTSGTIILTLPSGAIVSVSTNGDYTYDPNGQFDSLDDNDEGIDTFTYTVSDGNGGTDEATVTILMPGANDPPDAEDDSKTTLPTSTVSDSAILPNDSDPEDDDLTLIEVNGGRIDPLVGSSVTIGLPSGAIVTINTDGDYTYNPNGQFDSLDANEEGIDTFTYTISDGNGGTDEATVTILMPGVNDPPEAEDDSKTTLPTSTVSDSAILPNDSDPEDDDLTLIEVNGGRIDPLVSSSVTIGLPSGAIVTINTDGDYTYNPNGQFDSLDANEEGIDTFTYTISDGNGGTDEATVTILMPGANDHPDAEDDSKTTLPTSTVSDSAILPNDSDPEDDDLTLTEANGERIDPTSGTIILTLPSGAIVSVSTNGDYTYDPNGQFDSLDDNDEGIDTFTYTVSDGNGGTDEATVTILMPGVNDPPMPEDDVHSLQVGEALAFSDDAFTNDSDPDSDELTAVAINNVTSDIGMEITLPSGANVTLDPDGTYSYEPGGEFESLALGESTSDTFEYTVSDGRGHKEVATVTIILHGENDPPAAADDSESTTEDAPVSFDSLLGNDSDPDGDNLTVKSVEGSAGNVDNEITLPSGAKVTLTSDGLYTFDPNGQYESLNDSETASETFRYTITDGNGGTAEATVTIVITGINDPPVAENDDLGPAPAGLPVTYNLLTNDVNPEQQDELLVTEVEGQSVSSSGSTTISLSSGALLTIDGSTGEMTVDPNGQFDSLNGSQNATITFEYVVADGNGVTDSAIVTLTLLGRDTDGPSSMPSALPSPTPCIATYWTNELLPNDTPDPDFGNLLSCGSDDDCGGIVLTDPITGNLETYGARCDQETCQCVCNEEYCLAREDQQSSDDTSCRFQCNCKGECLFPDEWTGSPTASASDRCGGQCDDCSNVPCEDPDTDCIEQADGSFICVDSGLCTAAKEVMCDNAYQPMTGSNNNRAKCCPATSGCVKGTMGVIATSTCGNVCGTSCLGQEANPGNADGYSPSTFCIFGSRVLNMAYCPVIADANIGNTQVWGCESTDPDKQDLLCCSGARDGSGVVVETGGTDYDGLFNCTAEHFGYMSSNIFSPNGTQVCIDKVESLTGVSGRITPLCEVVE